MNKKNIYILAVVLLLAAVGGFFAFQKVKAPQAPQTQQPAQEQSQQNQGENTPQAQVEVGPGGVEVEAEGANGGGGLFVCKDECGNGVCQTGDPSCAGMNCVCPETTQECPQDCK